MRRRILMGAFRARAAYAFMKAMMAAAISPARRLSVHEAGSMMMTARR